MIFLPLINGSLEKFKEGLPNKDGFCNTLTNLVKIIKIFKK